MSKWLLRGVSIFVIVACVFTGFYYVNFYDTGNENAGVVLLRLLYEYDDITEVYDRSAKIRGVCSPDAWDWLSPDNEVHFDATWGRTENASTKVRVVWSRPGFIIYALENIYVQPSDLWCFEYEVEQGMFTNIREYKLSASREDAGGGLF